MSKLLVLVPMGAILSFLVFVTAPAPAPRRGPMAAESVVPVALNEPFVFAEGDRICLLGSAIAERLQHDGWLESHIQARQPNKRLSFRNLGFSADTLTVQQRTAGFGTWDDYLGRCRASVIFAFFGFNESFADVEGLPAFKKDLETFIAARRAQRYDGKHTPRLVLFSSNAFENLNDPNLPDGVEHNRRLRLYAEATAEIARKFEVPFVDLFAATKAAYAESEEPLTINGIHFTEEGNRVLAGIIARALCGEAEFDASAVTRLRDAVVDKDHLWFNRYRATDGYNVYGGRSSLTYDGVTNFTVLQRELEILDAMCENRDGLIQALALGKEARVDDSNLPARLPVKTNKPGPLPGGAHPYVTGEQGVSMMTVAKGMEVNLFASEGQFPEFVNPVQMAFDAKGRLWVAVWPTYPHWAPGDKMNDKLLILEDTDGDGRADTCTPFVEDLHNPTGFEFWNGGVVVGCAPDLLFLKDTDGDGRADHRERLLHGLSSADTHHGANSFEIGPDGALYFQEGTFHQSQVESIYGPIRNHDGCVWRFEPRTFRVERYVPYNFANPHGHVFDDWGQDFVTDGTGNVNYYALPFSGFIQHPKKHSGYFPFFRQQSRPCAGTEILSSSAFPEENRGNYLVANVIGFRGIFQLEVSDDGSGFAGKHVEPIVQSEDQNFRPADIEIGPDGAIYFLDWHNTIIGHMQHHLRDPNRDRVHGRVYRVIPKGRPLLTPVDVAGKPIKELLDLLKAPEYRLRNRARLELSAHPSAKVLAAVDAWVKGLDRSAPDYEHQCLEALWLYQQHNGVDRALLTKVLTSEDPRARAAATRVVRGMRHQIDDALDLLLVAAKDVHPRVRLEAVVAASHFTDPKAVLVAFEVMERDQDRFLQYALKETMVALEPVWKLAIQRNELSLEGKPKAIDFLLGLVSETELVKLPRVPQVLEALATRHSVPMAVRKSAIEDLARSRQVPATRVILDVVAAVDKKAGMHAGHVLHDLGMVLASQMDQGANIARDELAALASRGSLAETRTLAVAALARNDGGVSQVFSEAAQTREGLLAFLSAVPMMSPAHRTASYDLVRPLMFQVPEAFRVGTKNEASPGVFARYYEQTPRDARLETFRALKPDAEGHLPGFTIDTSLVRRRDEFGMLYEGILSIAKPGRYVFFTNSDDGSRLYLDGKLVVENDGPHAMIEKRGTVELAPGAYPIAVTYFDSGGGDGLIVSWKGPGFAKQPIPQTVVTTSGADPIRVAAIAAVASAAGHAKEKFQDAARLLGEGGLMQPALALLDNVSQDGWPVAEIPAVIDSIAARVASLPAERRTSPDVIAALESGRRLATGLPSDAAAASRERLAGLGGTTVLVRTLPHQMKYDRRHFYVEAGKPVAIVFQNNDMMPHNLVITRPGQLESIGQVAEAMGEGSTKTGAQYIPDSDQVLWFTSLVLPGENARLSFVAPTETGEYPFVCTFPGHWRVMNGLMKVVDKIDPELAQASQPVASKTPSAAARRFVKMWTVKDLAASLDGDWGKMRDLSRGRRMFAEAGCIKCHRINGEGTEAAPDLSKISEKYQGVELLRQIIEPSLKIQEGYESYIVETVDNEVIDGVVIKDDGKTVHLRPDFQDPSQDVMLDKSDVKEMTKMKSSVMPTGLLVTLSEREILDLLAYLQSGGK